MITVFPERLRTLREEKEIGQIAFAKALDVGKSTVSQWETGRSEPTLSNLVAIAEYFDVSLDYLAGRVD